MSTQRTYHVSTVIAFVSSVALAFTLGILGTVSQPVATTPTGSTEQAQPAPTVDRPKPKPEPAPKAKAQEAKAAPAPKAEPTPEHDWTRGLPECVYEDGSGGPTPCYWDGKTSGNGKGDSYIIEAPKAKPAPEPDWTRGLPACEYEDSENCYWDATERGNGIGDSFVNVDGEIEYVTK